MALDAARKAAALADADHVDPLNVPEDVHGDFVADVVVGGAVDAHFAQPASRLHVGLTEMSAARQRGQRGAQVSEADLHGLIAVGFARLDLHDGTRAHLQHGDRGHLSGFLVEDLGHAQLLAQQRFHDSSSAARVRL